MAMPIMAAAGSPGGGVRAALQRLHLLLVGVCAASLAFGWVESLYFVFGLPGPVFIGADYIDMALLPLLFLVGVPWATISPCCRCCYERRKRSPAESGCCCRCCGRCCPAAFGWLPRSIGRLSDTAITCGLPLLLVGVALPWPVKSPKLIIAHLAFVALAVVLRRRARFDGALAGQSVLLLAAIRTAGWSPNVLFWSASHAAAVAAPALVLQLGLHVMAGRSGRADEPTSVQVVGQAELAAEKQSLEQPPPVAAANGAAAAAAAAAAGPTTAGQTEAGDTAAAPSPWEVVSAAVFLTTFAHYVLYIAPGAALLLRGAGGGLVPELSTTVLPLLPWFLSECAAVWLAPPAGRGSSIAFRGDTPAGRIAAAAFVALNLGGGVPSRRREFCHFTGIHIETPTKGRGGVQQQ